jgi:hypothetical protein
VGGAVNTDSFDVDKLTAFINSNNSDAIVENVISTYHGIPITEWNLIIAPIVLRCALSVKMFDICIKLNESQAVFDLLDRPSTAMNLRIILDALCEIEAKEECEWMIALKKAMPSAVFPQSPVVAREISRAWEEERYCDMGQSHVIADLCERAQSNNWDTYGCFHRWAVSNQQVILLDIYRRDVVNLISRGKSMGSPS